MVLREIKGKRVGAVRNRRGSVGAAEIEGMGGGCGNRRGGVGASGNRRGGGWQFEPQNETPPLFFGLDELKPPKPRETPVNPRRRRPFSVTGDSRCTSQPCSSLRRRRAAAVLPRRRFSRLSETYALRSPCSSLSCVVLLFVFVISPFSLPCSCVVVAVGCCCRSVLSWPATTSPVLNKPREAPLLKLRNPLLHPVVLRCSRRVEFQNLSLNPLSHSSSLLYLSRESNIVAGLVL
ncbi:hypothetical protein BVRB_5g112080 [Beta vulgaris subsp. vulgaris]|nr:hypothetical protein BVRB_5g112080 [Beta vulgaris subsp. vulgaris]